MVVSLSEDLFDDVYWTSSYDLLLCLVWDEDVLNVEHVLTFMTVLGACVAAARVFIPDENLGEII